MKIRFVSDYVCPYCFVAKTALKQAMDFLKNPAIEIEWIPFELTIAPKERVDTYHDEVRKARYQILVEPCKTLGIPDMKLPPNVVPRPYTDLAFYGFYYAKENNCLEQYNDLVYNGYFIDEKDISDIDVIKSYLNQCGLDTTSFEEMYTSKKYQSLLDESNRYCREDLEVKGVPTIYVNDKKISIKEYSVNYFVDILMDNYSEEDQQAALVCGIKGCD